MTTPTAPLTAWASTGRLPQFVAALLPALLAAMDQLRQVVSVVVADLCIAWSVIGQWLIMVVNHVVDKGYFWLMMVFLLVDNGDSDHFWLMMVDL